MTPYRDGNLIGPQADSEWLYVVPWGIRALIGHISTRYSGPPGGIWITENGVDVPNEASQPYPAVLADTFRTSYYQVPPVGAVTAPRLWHPGAVGGRDLQPCTAVETLTAALSMAHCLPCSMPTSTFEGTCPELVACWERVAHPGTPCLIIPKITLDQNTHSPGRCLPPQAKS